MIDLNKIKNIFIFTGYTDMMLDVNSLSGLISEYTKKESSNKLCKRKKIGVIKKDPNFLRLPSIIFSIRLMLHSVILLEISYLFSSL